MGFNSGFKGLITAYAYAFMSQLGDCALNFMTLMFLNIMIWYDMIWYDIYDKKYMI